MKKLVFYSFFIFVVNVVLLLSLSISFDFFVYLLFDYSCFGFALKIGTGHFAYFLIMLLHCFFDIIILVYLFDNFVSCLKLKLKTK